MELKQIPDAICNKSHNHIIKNLKQVLIIALHSKKIKLGLIRSSLYTSVKDKLLRSDSSFIETLIKKRRILRNTINKETIASSLYLKQRWNIFRT